ncbi:hypothetical protein D3C71_2058240 [compost metagenome]
MQQHSQYRRTGNDDHEQNQRPLPGGRRPAKQGPGLDVEAVSTAQGRAFHQHAIENHRKRQRQHGEENLPIAGHQQA